MTGRWRWLRTPDRRLLALGVLLQLALAAVPVHRSYDRTSFEAAGYLVATGRSPYALHDLSGVFHDAAFRVFDTIGYPPPWPLLLGGIYRLTYALVPHARLYDVAIKLPVVVAAVCLAYLAAATLQNLGAEPRIVRGAWLGLLFNPFLVYVTAVRGQIDPIVALLALAALLLVASDRRDLSAVTLALAVCFKPIATPFLLAVLATLAITSATRALRYLAVFVAGVLVFYLLPFAILGWDTSPFGRANAQLALSGAMSPATVAGLWTTHTDLAGHWWLLGLAWLPALAIAVFVAQPWPRGVPGLFALGAGLTLVFFLVRPWLSETNIVLLLPLGMVLTALGRVDRRLYLALWLPPLLMTLTYFWPVKLLWSVAPDTVAQAGFWAERSDDLLLGIRVALILAWQVAGWWAAVVCLRPTRAPDASALAGRATLSPAGPPSPAAHERVAP